MSTRDTIINKLREAFLPESLDVTDESHLHEGHAGHRPGGETHFRVYIVSPAFEGKSRIERHRMVNTTLEAELKGSVHALGDQGAGAGERVPGKSAGEFAVTGENRSWPMRMIGASDAILGTLQIGRGRGAADRGLPDQGARARHAEPLRRRKC